MSFLSFPLPVSPFLPYSFSFFHLPFTLFKVVTSSVVSAKILKNTEITALFYFLIQL